MNSLKIVVSDNKLDPDDKKVVIEGLLSHHASKGHLRRSKTISIVLKDTDEKVVGGVIVTFLWNGMQINSLWIDERLRNRGWGRKLMQIVEKEAIRKGCTIAYTDTFPWQAPKFYEKLGYKLYGKLIDFPEGFYLSYYYKKLV